MLVAIVLLGFGIVLGSGCIQSWRLLLRVHEATQAAQNERHEMLTCYAGHLGFSDGVDVVDNLANVPRAVATASLSQRRN